MRREYLATSADQACYFTYAYKLVRVNKYMYSRAICAFMPPRPFGKRTHKRVSFLGSAYKSTRNGTKLSQRHQTLATTTIEQSPAFTYRMQAAIILTGTNCKSKVATAWKETVATSTRNMFLYCSSLEVDSDWIILGNYETRAAVIYTGTSHFSSSPPAHQSHLGFLSIRPRSIHSHNVHMYFPYNLDYGLQTVKYMMNSQ